MGLVSRVAPVHTAVRNCTRDEGRSFEVGNQVLISSHRKLLSSKAMVVNVAEKSERDLVSLRPLRNAAARDAEPSADPPLINPTTGIAGCCARALSGHATAEPPRAKMNSRR
jgi:hypothetical protein